MGTVQGCRDCSTDWGTQQLYDDYLLYANPSNTSVPYTGGFSDAPVAYDAWKEAQQFESAAVSAGTGDSVGADVFEVASNDAGGLGFLDGLGAVISPSWGLGLASTDSYLLWHDGGLSVDLFNGGAQDLQNPSSVPNPSWPGPQFYGPQPTGYPVVHFLQKGAWLDPGNGTNSNGPYAIPYNGYQLAWYKKFAGDRWPEGPYSSYVPTAGTNGPGDSIQTFTDVKVGYCCNSQQAYVWGYIQKPVLHVRPYNGETPSVNPATGTQLSNGSSHTPAFTQGWADSATAALNNYPQAAAFVEAHLLPVGPASSENQGGRNRAQLSSSQVCHCAGEPVDAESGNFYESQTDTRVGGRGLGLDLVRTYNSQDAVSASSPGPFGYGWSSTFTDHLGIDGSGNVTVHFDNGSTTYFTKNQDGSFSAEAWAQATLSYSSSTSTYTLILPDGRYDTFDSNGRLFAYYDRDGNAETLAYAQGGTCLCPSTVTDPAGRTLTLAYNADWTVSSVTDPAGEQVHYGYTSGTLTSVTDVGGKVTSYAYDSSRQLTTLTDPRGEQLTNVYDSSHRVTQQTDARGHSSTFAYSPNETQFTDQAGHVTDYKFGTGVLTSRTEGYGTSSAATTSYGYDADLNPVSVTDPNGHTWQYGYDAAGNRTSTTDPLGHKTTWTYNGHHDVTSTTTPAGIATTIAYDAHFEPTSVTRTLTETNTQQTTSYTYDSNEQLITVTDPLNRSWTYGYDSYGDRTSATSPLGHKTTYGFDADSRETSTVSARGNEPGANPAQYTTSYTLNAYGNPTTVTDPLGKSTTLAYDANQNLTDETDRDGRHTQITYDAANEPTQVTRPDGSTQKTSYDPLGSTASQTDALNNTTSYAYDALERLSSVTDPLSRATSFGYDGAGNRTSLTDPAGQTTTYGFDNANRLTSLSYSSGNPGNVSFGYDADGRRTSMTDSSGTTSYAYDSIGRLTSQTNGASQKTSYGYDLADQLTSIGYPTAYQPRTVGGQLQAVSTGTVTRTYDNDGNLASVSDWLGHTTQFSYDPEEQLTSVTRPNGTSASYAYDANGQLTSLSDLGIQTSYGRTNEGLLSSVTPSQGAAQSYGYDNVPRLTGVGSATSNYQYDNADNLTQTTVSGNPAVAQVFDAANEITSTGFGTAAQRTFGYDSRGNRTSATDALGETTSYSYDQAAELSAVNATAPTALSAQYAYDGDGLRQSKTVNNTQTYEAYDLSGSLPLMIEDGPTAYVTGPGGLPVEQIASDGTIRYYSHDQLGSTTALTDQNGTTVGTFTYDAYGNPGGSTGTATTPFGYAGQYADPETGLQYDRARYYEPSTGQFLTRDPLAAQTREPYAYVAGNPTNGSDPTGETALTGAAGAADGACGLTFEVPGLDVLTCGAAVLTTSAAGALALHDALSSTDGNGSQAVAASAGSPNECALMPANSGLAWGSTVVFAKQQPAALSPAEQQALENKRLGLDYDRSAYKSARRKEVANQKAAGERNRQKRQGN